MILSSTVPNSQLYTLQGRQTMLMERLISYVKYLPVLNLFDFFFTPILSLSFWEASLNCGVRYLLMLGDWKYNIHLLPFWLASICYIFWLHPFVKLALYLFKFFISFFFVPRFARISYSEVQAKYNLILKIQFIYSQTCQKHHHREDVN